ncbi:MAG: sarcosine oxidase subunit gamma family protein [Chloroflexota bacterium]
MHKYTALHSIAFALNARFKTVDGWQVPNVYTSIEEELKTSERRVGLIDQSANSRIIVEGSNALALLKSLFKVSNLGIHQGEMKRNGPAVFALRPDRFLILDLPGKGAERVEALKSGANNGSSLVTITDITHGSSEIMLVGPDSDDLLSAVCGLDFHDSIFPDMSAKQSSVAKTAQTIIHRNVNGLRSYTLIGTRSYGVYLWETLIEAGAQYNAAPVGLAAYDRLLK